MNNYEINKGEIWEVDNNGSSRLVVVLACFERYAATVMLQDQLPGSSAVEVRARDIMYADAGRLGYVFYDKMVEQLMACQGDARLYEAAIQGYGIRILRQPVFETIITFLVSQNNNIPRIKATIEKLCERFGRKMTAPGGQQYYTFPEPEVLADVDKLQGLGLGYRDKYIAAAAKIAASGCIDIERLEAEEYSTAKLILTNFLGVGEKVADCICLFALHKLEAFPVDTWVKKIEERYYGGRFPREKYAGYQGVMQQYLFAYIRNTEK